MESDVSRAERQRDTDTETMDELREQLRLKSQRSLEEKDAQQSVREYLARCARFAT